MAKKINSIFALINEENELIGYFKTAQLALSHVERNEIEESTVLEVVGAFDIVAPEEPQYELYDKELGSLLKVKN